MRLWVYRAMMYMMLAKGMLSSCVPEKIYERPESITSRPFILHSRSSFLYQYLELIPNSYFDKKRLWDGQALEMCALSSNGDTLRHKKMRLGWGYSDGICTYQMALDRDSPAIAELIIVNKNDTVRYSLDYRDLLSRASNTPQAIWISDGSLDETPEKEENYIRIRQTVFETLQDVYGEENVHPLVAASPYELYQLQAQALETPDPNRQVHVYIQTHGDENGYYKLGRQTISPEKIRLLIETLGSKSHLISFACHTSKKYLGGDYAFGFASSVDKGKTVHSSGVFCGLGKSDLKYLIKFTKDPTKNADYSQELLESFREGQAKTQNNKGVSYENFTVTTGIGSVPAPQ